ncbi:discoidin domain-containing protein [Fodinibius salsisoli]|uniref:Discoidin domain-containing protein n=1 Tax=Fodinibius salsisoli TaxID=2820877 RepID=A0ABT3PQ50_9BACT|nr:discoidin domain-containing protein [Fodinibius salsisoli]MCW9707983.1 discoidin domain-containing protein [Fodinibius salsisoli]
MGSVNATSVTNAYNLNVVYFSPTDHPPHANYEERISEIMLYLQDYYGQWMQQWGYGNKTFGLNMKPDTSMVDIIHIEADHSVDHYPYNGGADEVMDEVNAYFNANPSKKTSDHILVLMSDEVGNPGVPFYGIGRWCFALDAGPLMDVDNLGAGGDAGEQAGWIGGLAHELGHGLNLPHNSHKQSEEQQHGTALMDNGNHVFDQPTFLTPVDAAILNTNQVFSSTTGSFYGQVNASLQEVSGSYQNGYVAMEGKFQTDTPVTDVIVYQDPEGNSTYNQIGWTVEPNLDNTFSVSMPASELYETTDKNYQLKVRLVFQNGITKVFSVQNYTYTNGVPDLAFDYGPRPIYDRANWQVIDFSSQEGSSASSILDDDPGTTWHSRWSDIDPDPTHPHYLTVDMGEELPVDGLQFVQRQDGRRNIKDLKIEISSDGQSWQTLGTYELAHTSLSQSLTFSSAQQFRYFRMTTQSAWDTEQYAALAEVGAFGKGFWEVTSFSSEEPAGEGANNGRATDAIDSDSTTFWHSQWYNISPVPDYPHSLTIDMKGVTEVSGFTFIQRQNGQRHIKDLEIKVSVNGTNWTSLGTFQLANTVSEQTVSLGAVETFQYFKLIAQSAWDGEQFAALAEVGVY